MTHRRRGRRPRSCSASRCRTTISRGPAPICRCAARGRRAHEGTRHRRELWLLRDWGREPSVTFSDAVDIEDDHGDGRPARRPRRDSRGHTGRVLARRHHAYRESVERARVAAAGDFAVRFDPKGQLVAFATGYATDANLTHADRARGDVDWPRGDQEGVRRRRVRLRARSHRTLLPRRQDGNDVAEPGDEVRARRAAASQPAGRAADLDRPIARAAARLQIA